MPAGGSCEVALGEDPEVEAAEAAEAVLSLLSSQNTTASPDSSDSNILSSESNHGFMDQSLKLEYLTGDIF